MKKNPKSPAEVKRITNAHIDACIGVAKFLAHGTAAVDINVRALIWTVQEGVCWFGKAFIRNKEKAASDNLDRVLSKDRTVPV